MVGRRGSPLLRWYLDHSHADIPLDVYMAFREEMFKELLENPEGVTLPANLGWLKIVGSRGAAVRRESLNIPKEIRGDKEVYYPNFHTDGWVFKVFWYSRPVGSVEDIVRKGFFNSEAYGFRASKTLKKMMAEKIKRGEWDHYQKKSFHRAPRTKGKVGRPKNSELAARAENLDKQDNED